MGQPIFHTKGPIDLEAREWDKVSLEKVGGRVVVFDTVIKKQGFPDTSKHQKNEWKGSLQSGGGTTVWERKEMQSVQRVRAGKKEKTLLFYLSM